MNIIHERVWNFIGLQLPIIVLLFLLPYSITSAKSSTRDEGALTFTDDGAWCWFQDPRAVYVKGKRQRIYAQWVTHDGKLQVGAYDLTSGKIEVITLKENWDADDHNVGAFLVLKDKRLMLFYAQHNKEGIFCRTSAQPEDISSWEDEVTISKSTRITYAHPVYLSRENMFYVFWRGSSWKPTYSTSTNGKTWNESQILLQDLTRESNDIRPYTKIVSDGKSTIHFAFTDGHPNAEPQNSVYYLKYEKGKFFKADGSLAGDIQHLPVPHSECDLVYNGKINKVRAWIWDIALDIKRLPVIVYTRYPSETDHRYHYARWTGTIWLDVELARAGKWFPQTPEGVEERETYYSGGIVLDKNKPSTVYLSREIDGIFELEQWETTNKGRSWNITQITANSEKLNIRPVVPVGTGGNKNMLLWMFGDYKHFTKFRTEIKMLPLK